MELAAEVADHDHGSASNKRVEKGADMIDAETQAVLQDILRRESRSLLSYIGDAYPWTTTEGGSGLKTLLTLIKQEAAAVTSLGRHLVRSRIPTPFIGSYPASFTSWNFIALGHLVPRLLDEQKRAIVALEANLPRIHDEKAKEEVERLLGVKKMTMACLEVLAPPATAIS